MTDDLTPEERAELTREKVERTTEMYLLAIAAVTGYREDEITAAARQVAQRARELDLTPEEVRDLVMKAVEYAEEYDTEALQELSVDLQRAREAADEDDDDAT
jgi:hypothetical protein